LVPWSTRSLSSGSPPPLRGTVVIITEVLKSLGITPAPAGNRADTFTDFDLNKDHPRPCGEQYRVDNPIMFPLGSPPPLRGTEAEAEIREVNTRITPAPAGNRLDKTQRYAIMINQNRIIRLVSQIDET